MRWFQEADMPHTSMLTQEWIWYGATQLTWSIPIVLGLDAHLCRDTAK